MKQVASSGHKWNVNFTFLWHLLLGAYELIHFFMLKKNCVIYATSITCHCTKFTSLCSQMPRICAPLQYVMLNSFLTFLYLQSTHLTEACTIFEGQTVLSCVQILDKLRHIYCMWHHKVARLLLWYSSLCVIFSNTDLKTFVIKQFYKHDHFRCCNILKEPAISKSSTHHLPKVGDSWFHQMIGNYLMNYTASHPKQL